MACCDSVGLPYEVTLELHRDGTLYGTVGERCGWLLVRLARGVARARADHGARWSDPDDRFPDEEELFAFRYRTRNGVVSGGELRCQLRTIPIWTPARRGAAGEWRLTRRAFVEAWGGGGGVGLRAVLTSAELAAFVEALITEAEECLAPEKSGNSTRTR
ncbi:hypothetical protein OHA77_25570 [Streptosporangium sp. NBC_01639]|uniref:hypothetical protein n=1 Tax=unclassified Streptosporangium TaxID=2632669 RepID=UPI002DDB071F|nr:hypothetical protein [Streptosporangium sp. NBC_01756]WSC89295.1 hypothetical protein OIE48_14240 [Streptosporangium sp. NBC_01756]WTD52034.1 hypothetical protein OHA77_25570 [Streptosporangium sp. NBC_01639]